LIVPDRTSFLSVLRMGQIFIIQRPSELRPGRTLARRRSIKILKKPAITITRHGLTETRLVYVAKANKAYKYRYGQSAIAYIGTSERGVKRIAESAASKAQELLGGHGVKQLDFYVVSCSPLQKVATWEKLENALILVFRERYGEVPRGNIHGKNYKWGDELSYFSEQRLRAIIEKLSLTNA
jgi:hypothetical protein